MALFGTDKEESANTEDSNQEVSEKEVGAATKNPSKRIDNSLHDILVKPHITEKATYMTDDGVYTFVVKKTANKPQIKQAVKDVYGVDVKKVRTVKLPKKRVQSRRGNDGVKGGIKKAYVYLKEGDSIELM